MGSYMFTIFQFHNYIDLYFITLYEEIDQAVLHKFQKYDIFLFQTNIKNITHIINKWLSTSKKSPTTTLFIFLSTIILYIGHTWFFVFIYGENMLLHIFIPTRHINFLTTSIVYIYIYIYIFAYFIYYMLQTLITRHINIFTTPVYYQQLFLSLYIKHVTNIFTYILEENIQNH